MAKINQVKLKQDADAAERAGRFDKAIDSLKQIVQGNARDWATVNRIGDLYGKLNNPRAANEQYVKLARYFAEVGFHLKAVAVWKKVLRNEPSLLEGHVSLGELYQKQGLVAEARQTFSFVYDEYVKLNKLREAGEVLRRMAEVDPGDMQVRIRLAECYGRDGNPDKAAAEFIGIAEELVKKGLLKEALQLLEEALRSAPGSPRLLVASARVHLLQKDYAEAGGQLEEAHRAAPADREVALLAEIYAREGNREEAAGEVLRRMAEVDSSDMKYRPRRVPSDREEPIPLKESPATPQQPGTNGVHTIDLDHFEADPAIIKIISAETARKYQVLPLSRSGATLTIAMADPTNVLATDDIKFMTGYNVQPVVASGSALAAAIERRYGPAPMLQPEVGPNGGRGGPDGRAVANEISGGSILSIDDLAAVGRLSEVDLDELGRDFGPNGPEGEAHGETEEIDLSADAAPISKFTNVLLVDSLKRGASDIHIEPYQKEFRVRYRIDGILYNVMAMPMWLRDPLISRVKSIARLNLGEKRLPQDGRIKITIRVEDRSREVDYLVSVLPTICGEKIVLRLLDKSKLMLDMTKLGFERYSLERFKEAISKPYGIVLITGPTGSGKTSTLYAAIAALNKPDTNIMTAEDPAEFYLPGINQVQIKDQIGLSFSTLLRSFLRQDPNIILVGAIHDDETADAVVSVAARMSCLVLAGMNEADAASAVEAFMKASRRPFQVGRTLRAVVAQRLVRRLCVKCRSGFAASAQPATLSEVGVGPDNVVAFPVAKGRGCVQCNGTGYRGRVGLFEVLEVTPGIRSLIEAGSTAAEIRKKAVEQGMLTLHGSGLQKVKDGLTTMEEVLRETEP